MKYNTLILSYLLVKARVNAAPQATAVMSEWRKSLTTRGFPEGSVSP